MARQFVIFALVLFVAVSFAAETAESPKGSLNNTDVGADLLAPGADSAIGNTDGAAAPGAGDDVVEAPIGGPGAEGATGSTPAESPKGGASAIEFSVVAVMAAAAVFFF